MAALEEWEISASEGEVDPNVPTFLFATPKKKNDKSGLVSLDVPAPEQAANTSAVIIHPPLPVLPRMVRSRSNLIKWDSLDSLTEGAKAPKMHSTPMPGKLTRRRDIGNSIREELRQWQHRSALEPRMNVGPGLVEVNKLIAELEQCHAQQLLMAEEQLRSLQLARDKDHVDFDNYVATFEQEVRRSERSRLAAEEALATEKEKVARLEHDMGRALAEERAHVAELERNMERALAAERKRVRSVEKHTEAALAAEKARSLAVEKALEGALRKERARVGELEKRLERALIALKKNDDECRAAQVAHGQTVAKLANMQSKLDTALTALEAQSVRNELNVAYSAPSRSKVKTEAPRSPVLPLLGEVPLYKSDNLLHTPTGAPAREYSGENWGHQGRAGSLIDRPAVDPVAPTPKRRTGTGETIRPELFNPAKEKWQDYANKFERIAKWNGWSEVETAQYIQIKLTGEPLNYLLRQSEDVLASWTAIRRVLDQYFVQPGLVLKYQAEFESALKSPSETWGELAQRLRTIAEKAYGKSGLVREPMFESILLARFLKMLPDNIYQVVVLKEVESVEEAAVLAMKVDASCRNAPPKPLPKRNEERVDTATALEELLRLARENVGAIAAAGQVPYYDGIEQVNTNRQTARGRGRGYVGRGRGRGGSLGFPSDREEWKAQQTCYRCHGRGHFAHECPAIRPVSENSGRDAVVERETQTGPVQHLPEN